MKRRLSIAAIAILACTFDPSVEAIDLNDRDLTGSWHMPGFAGQGLQIEVYPNVVAPGVGFLQGSWATFEPFV